MNARISVTELFSREEIKELTTPSDLGGLWAVGSTWAVIVGTFAGVAVCGLSQLQCAMSTGEEGASAVSAVRCAEI